MRFKLEFHIVCSFDAPAVRGIDPQARALLLRLRTQLITADDVANAMRF
jgi:hypothetical protein